MTWWHYLLLANVYLTLFYVFYTLFLRKETFFNLNRVYLVSAAILSFLIPVVQSSWIKKLFITKKVHETIFYHVSPVVLREFNVTASRAHQVITIGQLLAAVYLIGILALTIRFIYQLAIINWAISQSGTEATYSFLNQIKVEEHDADNAMITAHEEVHVRQWHTADILLMEAIMIINWFNPIVYFYRTAIKHIHEFIADRDAVKGGADKTDYAMLLLSQTFTAPPYELVTPFFNQSLLKQRILMLHRNQSQYIMLIKYGLSAPLFALMLVLSSATVNKSKTIIVINHKAQQMLQAPADFNNNTTVTEITFQAGDGYYIPDSPDSSSMSEQDKKDLMAVIRQHQAAAAIVVPAKAITTANVDVKEVSPAEQENNDTNNEIFTAVEEPADFPGGVSAFNQYVKANLHYPQEAQKNNIQGRVFAQFVVEKDGSVSDVKVVRGIGGGADEETVRILSDMPKWQPGVQNGHAIRQLFTVPVNFIINNDVKTVANNTTTQNVPDNSPDNNSAANSAIAGENGIFTAVEVGAHFPGGVDKFYKFLSEHLHYPAEARQENVQGKVFVTFIVEKDGSITNAHVLREPGAGLGKEALRVISLSPKWVPGLQNGRAVRQQYTVPIAFTFGSDKIGMNTDGPVKDQQQILASTGKLAK